ncbi:MAG: hypothetical protein SVY10_10935 [Thermodesulfobacteriota bacterium]|nr:hypothetical protein [Thermodesulfobacteriota bacterium]
MKFHETGECGPGESSGIQIVMEVAFHIWRSQKLKIERRLKVMKKKILSFCCLITAWGILSVPVSAADDSTGQEQVRREVKERLQNQSPENAKTFRHEHRKRIKTRTQNQVGEPNVACNNRQSNKYCYGEMRQDRRRSSYMLRNHSGLGSAVSRRAGHSTGAGEKR